jgi:hypothetical protein
MTAPATKTCTICHKDVSNAKRVKDPQGHYFCAACHEAALQRQHTGSGHAAGKAPAVKVAIAPPPPADDGDLDLVPLATAPVPEPKPARPAPAESAPKPAARIPEFCPNCGAKTLPSRKFCIGCNRDLTKMDKVIAMKAEEAAGPSGEAKFASAFGAVLKYCLVLVGVAGLVFVAWVVIHSVKPVDTFEDYPTTREKAVRDFLSLVNEGTDKSYAKAFRLISFRERTTNASSDTEELRYKDSFKKMRQDFITRYGDDWHSKYQLVDAGSNDDYADDEVDFTLKLGEDSYKVATQAQIAVDIAGINMIKPSKIKPSFAENGKNHFGILDIGSYKVHDRRTMDTRVGVTGRQRPDDM